MAKKKKLKSVLCTENTAKWKGHCVATVAIL